MHADTEAYLNGELQGEALSHFEAELARNPNLREEVELLRPLVRDLRRAAITRKVEAAERNRRARRHMRLVVILLSIMLLIGLLGIWWWRQGSAKKSQQQPLNFQQDTLLPADEKPVQQQADLPVKPENNNLLKTNRKKNPDNARLFAAWFRPYQSETLEPSSRGHVELSPSEQFQSLYWQNNYRDALAAFENLGPSAKNNDNLLFLRANCLLAAGQANEAATLLEGIVQRDRSRFKAEAKWYLALSYLKMGKTSETRNLLRSIATEPGAARQPDAEKLLKEMD